MPELEDFDSTPSGDQMSAATAKRPRKKRAAKAPAGRSPKASRPLPKNGAGSHLAPDIGEMDAEADTQTYWFGALPDCPRAFINLGGLAFQKFVDPTVRDESDMPGAPARRGYMKGMVADLTQGQVQEVIDHLKRKFWRGGRLICLPRPHEVKELKERNRYRPIKAQGGDIPVADTVYIVKQGYRDMETPPSVYETGLEW